MEKRFAEAWEKQNNHQNVDRDCLTFLLHVGAQGGGVYMAPPSDRDRVVAATVIQWLGSPVGQGFLEELGYTSKRQRSNRA